MLNLVSLKYFKTWWNSWQIQFYEMQPKRANKARIILLQLLYFIEEFIKSKIFYRMVLCQIFLTFLISTLAKIFQFVSLFNFLPLHRPQSFLQFFCTNFLLQSGLADSHHGSLFMQLELVHNPQYLLQSCCAWAVLQSGCAASQ